MKFFKLILIFIFGIICFFTIESYFHDYVYSNEKNLLSIVEEVDEQSEDYYTFFYYSKKLSKNIDWDKLNYEIMCSDDKIKNIHFSINSTSGYAVYGCEKYTISLPNIIEAIEDSFIIEDISLSASQLDSLRILSNVINEFDFIIYKNETVIINKFFGDKFDKIKYYEMISLGKETHLLGNYWEIGNGNIFIGEKN